MGSSPDESYNRGAIAPQGPTPEQLVPGGPPPQVPSFLPGDAASPALWTQANIDAINAHDAAQRAAVMAMNAQAQQPQAQPVDPRQVLAMAMAEASHQAGLPPMNREGARRPEQAGGGFAFNPDWRPRLWNWSMGGSSPGYTTSGPFGGSSSANYGPGSLA